MIRTCLIMIPVIALVVALPSIAAPALAQSGQDGPDKATVAIDLQLDRVIANLRTAGLTDEDLSKFQLPDPLASFLITDVKRMFGAFSLPANLDAAQKATPDDLPLEFFMRIQFASAEKAKQALDILMQQGSQTEVDGKIYAVADTDNPETMMAHLTEPSELEIGTRIYLLHPDRNLMSSGLATAWKQVPDEGFRMAFDMRGNAGLFKEIETLLAPQAPPGLAPSLALLDNVDFLVLSADLKTDNLISLNIQGLDATDAAELKGGIDTLLGIARTAADFPLQELQKKSAAMADSTQSILGSLQATLDGKVVRVKIPRPGMLDQALKDAVAQSQDAASDVERLNRMRQLALSALNHASVYREFPFVPQQAQSNPGLSWRVRVLPFLEQKELYDKFDLSKGPGEEPNAGLVDPMPVFFGDVGPRATVAWIKSEVRGFAQVTDGTSNTIMLLEHPDGMPWIEHNSITQEQAIQLVSGLGEGQTLACAFYDGSVRMLDNSMDADTLRRLFNPRDGEIVEFDR